MTPELRLSLRLRDLAAGAAFIAVAITGLLPTPVSIFFVLCFGASFLGWHIDAEKRWPVFLLIVAAVVLAALVFRDSSNLPMVAATFATLLTAHRLISAPSESVNHQTLLAALLLMIGAAAISAEFWFAILLFIFGTCAGLSQALSITAATAAQHTKPIRRRVVIGLLLTIGGAALLFAIFPRLSWRFVERKSISNALGTSIGLSNNVTLNGSGTLKTNFRTVAKIRLKPDPKAQKLDRYWVAQRLVLFDGVTWKASGKASAEPPQLNSFGPITEQIYELLPAYGSRTLITLPEPLRVYSAHGVTAMGEMPVSLEWMPGRAVRISPSSSSYAAYAYRVQSSTAELPTDDAEESLELPKLDLRVAGLAREIVGNETDPGKRARLLETRLRGGWKYSLEGVGPADDRLAQFLFETRSGHCEHFATSLAVLLRTLGIPSRVVVGFYGGERVGERYLLRGGDAHAWVEALLPQGGWTTLDATPEDGRAGQAEPWQRRFIEGYEFIEEWWNSRVLDYSALDQIETIRGAQRGFFLARARLSLPHPRIEHLVIFAAALFLAWRLLRYLRRRTSPATRFLIRIDKLLERRGITPEPGTTVEELAAELRRVRHPLAGALTEATQAYLAARFGKRPLSRSKARALLQRFKKY